MSSNFSSRLFSACGNISAILIVLLIIVIICDITLRYVVGVSRVWIMELEWHIFAVSFLLAVNFTLHSDRHIRVDIFYNRFSPRLKAIMNLVGSIFLLIPWSVIAFKSSVTYTINSYVLMETTPDPGGLPFRFIVKAFIPLTFLLLIIQSFITVKKELIVIKSGNNNN